MLMGLTDLHTFVSGHIHAESERLGVHLFMGYALAATGVGPFLGHPKRIKFEI